MKSTKTLNASTLFWPEYLLSFSHGLNKKFIAFGYFKIWRRWGYSDKYHCKDKNICSISMKHPMIHNPIIFIIYFYIACIKYIRQSLTTSQEPSTFFF